MNRRARPSPNRDDFEALLANAGAGDQAAIAELYRRHNPPLIRFLEGRSSGLGADLAQETWLAAFSTLQTFDGDEGQFKAWLFTIARRRLIDGWRRAERRPVSAGPDALERLVAPDAGDGDGDGELSAREAVAEIVAHLPADQAEIVLLRIVADLSVEEVAGIVGKTPGAVRVAQHRALRRLAEALQPEPVTP